MGGRSAEREISLKSGTMVLDALKRSGVDAHAFDPRDHGLEALKALRKAGDLKLQAGMPAEVFIQTASRNALQYLVDPVLGFLQRSLREQ